MKKYLLLFILFASSEVKSQSIYNKQGLYQVDCYTAPDSLYRTAIVNNNNYKYLVFSVHRDENNKADATVLLRSLRLLSKEVRIEIARQLMKQFQLTQVLFFENCSIVKVSYQALEITPEQKKALKEGSDSFYARDILK